MTAHHPWSIQAGSLQGSTLESQSGPGLGPDTLVANLIEALATPLESFAGDPNAEGPIYGKGPNLPIDMHGEWVGPATLHKSTR